MHIKIVINTDSTTKDTSAKTIVNSVIISCPPVLVEFSDTLSTATSWYWNFGDSSTSTDRNPSHYYTVPGIYTITHVDKLKKGVLILPLWKDMSAYPGLPPIFLIHSRIYVQAQLLILRTLPWMPVLWYWNFGDGTTSTDQNPQHFYTTPDTFFQVSLTTTDTFGCSNTASKTIYTGYLNPLMANLNHVCADDSVYFSSCSQPTPASINLIYGVSAILQLPRP